MHDLIFKYFTTGFNFVDFEIVEISEIILGNIQIDTEKQIINKFMNNVLIIGCGHMGSALLDLWSKNKLYKFTVVDPLKYKIIKGYVHAIAPKGLVGSKIKFPKISVGATENLIIAASRAKGERILWIMFRVF